MTTLRKTKNITLKSVVNIFPIENFVKLTLVSCLYIKKIVNFSTTFYKIFVLQCGLLIPLNPVFILFLEQNSNIQFGST